MENEITLMDQLILKKFNIKIDYVLLECTVCKHTWGVKIYNDQVSPRNLVCKDCAAEKVFLEIE